MKDKWRFTHSVFYDLKSMSILFILFHVIALLNSLLFNFFIYFFFYLGVILEFHAGMCLWENVYLPACDASNCFCVFFLGVLITRAMCTKAFLPVDCENTAAMIFEKNSTFDLTDHRMIFCFALLFL